MFFVGDEVETLLRGIDLIWGKCYDGFFSQSVRGAKKRPQQKKKGCQCFLSQAPPLWDYIDPSYVSTGRPVTWGAGGGGTSG